MKYDLYIIVWSYFKQKNKQADKLNISAITNTFNSFLRGKSDMSYDNFGPHDVLKFKNANDIKNLGNENLWGLQRFICEVLNINLPPHLIE